MMPDYGLHEVLRKLRQRLLKIGITAGVGWGLAGGLAVLLLCAWLDLLLSLPSALRVVAGIGALAVGVGLTAGTGLIALRRASPPALGRRLDDVARTGGQILSGVDLLLEDQPPAALTRGLAQMAVARAADLARGVLPRRAAPTKPIQWPYGVVVGAVALCGGLALLAPRLVQTQWLRLVDPFGDHPPYSRIAFDVDPGDARVVYGSGLNVRVRAAGGPVERIELVLHGGDAAADDVLPMFPEPGGSWRATVANVTTASNYHVRAHTARSRRFKIDVITVPRLESVRFRVTPPAYTNRPSYEGPLPQDGLAGLPGTTVTVWARSNRPLARGAADVRTATGSQTAELGPAADAREVTGVFEIRQPGQLHLQVFDSMGQPSQEPFSAAVTLLSDERPSIRLMEPPAISLATPNIGLPVAVAAEDDYGLGRVQLYRSLNDSRALPLDIALPTPPATRWYGRAALPLLDYGLQPGDVIKLYARAEDDDPAGAKGSESVLAVVQIISQEDYQRLLLARQGMQTLQSKYQQAQHRMEKLAEQIAKLSEELNKLPPESELAQREREALSKLTEQLRQQADEMNEAANLDLPFDVDQQLKKHLQELADQLRQAADETAAVCQGLPKAGAAAKHLRQLSKKLAGGREQFEREALQPLEHLAKIFPLMEDEARFAALYLRQRDLAERLASLKGRDDEQDAGVRSRMRDLEAEQRQLRDTLGELLDDIESRIAGLPDDRQFDDLRRTAGEFAKGVRASAAAQRMAEGEAGLVEFSGTRGYEGALAVADILEQFLSRCKSMGQSGRTCLKFQPKLSTCLGNSVQQLLEATGSGMGQGTGGGYSARQSTLQNVGLYGDLPALGETDRSGAGQELLGVRGVPGAREPTEGGAPSALEALREGHASGVADMPIPLNYRRRVSEYFQRIADEAEGRSSSKP